MGAIGSKVEVVEDSAGTPVKCQVPCRQLEDDPRSPTANIPRTPIMVDKTPDGLLDPRSPTPGIWRTPINNFLKKDEAKSVQEDSKPLLPEGDILDDPEKITDVDCEKLPDADCEKIADTESEKLTGAECNKPEEKKDFQGAVAELQQLSLSDVDESSTLLEVQSKPAGTKKPKAQQKAQPKKLFYDKKRPSKALSSNPKSVLNSMTPPRSPLSTVVIDTNSPRVIMHRKQTKKIDAARQCRLDAIRPSLDKENVDM